MLTINNQQTTLNVAYVSDIHNNVKKIRHFKTAMDEFSQGNPNTIKLACGDLNFGTDLPSNILTLKALDSCGIVASSCGNHELEGGDFWIKALNLAKTKMKFLSANLNFSQKNPIQRNVQKSIIIEQQGQRIGIIGVSPLDCETLMYKSTYNNYFNVKNFHETVTEIKKEVEKLEKQGIKIIFLLAHTGEKSSNGFNYYQNLAKIGGIDLIVGDHDHKKYDNWLVTERGEPVKIVSTEAKNDTNSQSGDLNTFGIFKAVFSKDGILIPKKCKNQNIETEKYPENIFIKHLENKILKDKKVICHNDAALTCQKRKTEENPVANLLADSMFWVAKKTNPNSTAQIALINSGEIKADIPKGNVTIKDIKSAFPFTHPVTIVETSLTKKQIFEALNQGIETTTFAKQTLGLLQVGGLKYTVGINNKVKDVYLTDEHGNLNECLDDMPEDKEYSVLYDTYLMSGAGGMTSLIKDIRSKDVIISPYNHQSGVIEYLKTYFKHHSLDVKNNRIKHESNDIKIHEESDSTIKSQ